MHIKRDILIFSTIIFAIVIGPVIKIIFIVGLYYLFGAIIYIVTNLIYESRYMSYRRQIKKAEKLIDNTLSTSPAQIKELDNWLKKEGFVLRINDIGCLYLQSKTTRVDFFQILKERLSIRSIQFDNKEYLVYDEDEVLKIRLEDYLSYMTSRNQRIIEAEEKSNTLKINLFNNNKERGWNLANFWAISGRIQGYLFLLIGLMNIDEEITPNVAKFFIFIGYFVLEAS